MLICVCYAVQVITWLTFIFDSCLGYIVCWYRSKRSQVEEILKKILGLKASLCGLLHYLCDQLKSLCGQFQQILGFVEVGWVFCGSSYDPSCGSSYDTSCGSSYDTSCGSSYDMSCGSSYDTSCSSLGGVVWCAALQEVPM